MFMPMYWTNKRTTRHTMNQSHKNTLRAMKTDVLDEGDHFTVKADLPGFDRKDIHIGLRNGILDIRATHTDNVNSADNAKYLHRERNEASYARVFNVGDTIRPEEIHAKYENGVLTLTIPEVSASIKAEEELEAPKKIEVQ